MGRDSENRAAPAPLPQHHPRWSAASQSLSLLMQWAEQHWHVWGGWAKSPPEIQGLVISCRWHRHFHTPHKGIKGAEGTSGLQVDWAQSSKTVGTPGPRGQQPQTLIWKSARYSQTSSNASIPQKTPVQGAQWPGEIPQKTVNLQGRYWAQWSFSHSHRKCKLSGPQVDSWEGGRRKKDPNWEFNFELKRFLSPTEN